MIYVDVSTLKPFFKDVEDLDNNGIVSEGDRLVTKDDAYVVTGSHQYSPSKLADYLTNINDQGRQFRLLTDGDWSSQTVDYYLAYSEAGSSSSLEGITHLGRSEESYDADMPTTSYYDETDAKASLANAYSAEKYAGVDSAAARRYARLAAEYGFVIVSIRANWTSGDVQEKLVRKDELERKLSRLDERLGG